MKGAALALGLAFWLGAPVASALPDAPSAAEDAKARELFREGDRAYAEARYEDALARFEEAYRLSPRPRLLFNIGNALERLGQLADAADALERYLPDAKPNELDVLQKRIDNLRKRAAEKRARDRAEDDTDTDTDTDTDADAPAKRKRAKARAAPESEASEPTLGWVLVGAGGVAVATGATFGLMALSQRSEADASCKTSGGERLCDSRAREAIDRDGRYSLFADLGFGVGAVLAGAGAYLLLFPGPAEAPRKRAAWQTEVHASGSGGTLGVRARF